MLFLLFCNQVLEQGLGNHSPVPVFVNEVLLKQSHKVDPRRLLFPHHVDGRRKNLLLAEATVVVESACSSHVCVGFSGVSGFLPRPRDVQVK